VPAPRPRKISEFKPLFTNLAQTSHYQIIFGGLSGQLRSYLLRRGIDYRFIGDSVGLLCNSASLPGSSFATADIVGNYTRIIKFDRDYSKYIEYTFYGLFPLTLNSTAISYENSSILKASASFNYERYVCGRSYSIDINRREDNNRDPQAGTNFLNETDNNRPIYVPVSPGAAAAGGVRFRPLGTPTGEAIVTGQLRDSLL